MIQDLHPSSLHALLLPWYRRHRRDLPWRRTGDPYAILVSELMLQQTRVAVVLDRFPGFLARFPTIAALAGAREDDVVALWSGLGYYGRARRLHAAARAIRDRFDGAVPRNARLLRELPGVGPYTAAAVASIAFGLPEPLVDGNVARVLSRWFRRRGDPRAAGPARRLGALATKLVPRDGRAGDWNQALMELGETICTPRTPRCSVCPVARRCGAFLAGRPAAYPARMRAEPAVREFVVRIAIARSGRWLLRRNGPAEAPAGLFEFPAVGRGGMDTDLAELRAAAERLTGLRLRDARELGVVRHGILDREITVRALRARATGARASGRSGSGPLPLPTRNWRWTSLDGMDDLPVSAAALRLRALLQSRARSRQARRSSSVVPASTGRPRR